jgi:phospholipid/cholesterol/gamma-HCH transport system substrate-binding protein
VGGLKPRAAVKSAGVVVGRVEAIALDLKSFQARVTLSLEGRYVFPKDSSLKILTSGLLGEQYVGIEAGADSANLAAGDTIAATQSAVVLENLIGQFLYNKAADGATPGTAPKK